MKHKIYLFVADSFFLALTYFSLWGTNYGLLNILLFVLWTMQPLKLIEGLVFHASIHQNQVSQSLFERIHEKKTKGLNYYSSIIDYIIAMAMAYHGYFIIATVTALGAIVFYSSISQILNKDTYDIGD